jgi:protein-L-isoaspartate(D-aspartate) O-methyltransferase
MRTVPRERFVRRGERVLAYADMALPIGRGQTISQPYVVALMTEAAEVKRGDRVLEVGTGSGYAAAVLAEIGADVYTLDRIPELVDAARRRLAELGYERVHVLLADGTRGWAAAAPYDAIVVTAGGPRVPGSLRAQLRVGGRLVMPVGGLPFDQVLVRVRRTGPDDYEEETLGAVAFVPLIGEEGWGADESWSFP